jgi:hypothetical protein
VGLGDLGAVPWRQQLPAAQGLPVQGRGQSLRPRHGRPARSSWRVSNHHGVVAGLNRVVHDPGQVQLITGEQRREHPLVEPHPLARRTCLHDGVAGQFVPETHRVGAHLQDSAALGLGQPGQLAQHRASQPQLDPRRHNGQLLKGPLRRRVQLSDPRQHGVHHAPVIPPHVSTTSESGADWFSEA